MLPRVVILVFIMSEVSLTLTLTSLLSPSCHFSIATIGNNMAEDRRTNNCVNNKTDLVAQRTFAILKNSYFMDFLCLVVPKPCFVLTDR